MISWSKIREKSSIYLFLELLSVPILYNFSTLTVLIKTVLFTIYLYCFVCFVIGAMFPSSLQLYAGSPGYTTEGGSEYNQMNISSIKLDPIRLDDHFFRPNCYQRDVILNNAHQLLTRPILHTASVLKNCFI